MSGKALDGPCKGECVREFRDNLMKALDKRQRVVQFMFRQAAVTIVRYGPAVARVGAAAALYGRLGVAVAAAGGGNPFNDGAGVVILVGGTLIAIIQEVNSAGQSTAPSSLQADEGWVNSASTPPGGPDGDDNSNKKPQKIERLHTKDTILKDNPDGYEYWSGKSTREIVDSLSPSRTGPNDEPLIVNERGKIVQGNTRVLVLEERGFDINSLPRSRY